MHGTICLIDKHQSSTRECITIVATRDVFFAVVEENPSCFSLSGLRFEQHGLYFGQTGISTQKLLCSFRCNYLRYHKYASGKRQRPIQTAFIPLLPKSGRSGAPGTRPFFSPTGTNMFADNNARQVCSTDLPPSFSLKSYSVVCERGEQARAE